MLLQTCQSLGNVHLCTPVSIIQRELVSFNLIFNYETSNYICMSEVISSSGTDS